MSGIIICPQQRKEETDFDYFIKLAHDAYRGKGQKQWLAELTLTLRALDEMDSVGARDKTQDDSLGKRVRVHLAQYNLSESVERDLDLNPYGVAPSFNHTFSVIDSFAIFGRLGRKKSYTGFIIDYFKDMPTRTTAYIQNGTDEIVRYIASQSFGVGNNSGGIAYSEKAIGKRVLDLSGLGEREGVEAMVVDGEILFGGEGREQGKLITEIMQNCHEIRGFTPLRYALRRYDFGIDFGLKDGEKILEAGIRKLWERVCNVFHDKQERCVA